jgi:hypothetical protein
MKWVVVTGALGGALLFGPALFAQTGSVSPASTRAIAEPSSEDPVFERDVEREVKLLAFTRRLAAEEEAREARDFESGVARYMRVAVFMRHLVLEQEEQAAAEFQAQLALSSRVQHFMQKVEAKDLHRTLAPEPIDWIRGPRSSGAH